MSQMGRIALEVQERSRDIDEYNSICREFSQYWNGDISEDDLSLKAFQILMDRSRERKFINYSEVSDNWEG